MSANNYISPFCRRINIHSSVERISNFKEWERKKFHVCSQKTATITSKAWLICLTTWSRGAFRLVAIFVGDYSCPPVGVTVLRLLSGKGLAKARLEDGANRWWILSLPATAFRAAEVRPLKKKAWIALWLEGSPSHPVSRVQFSLPVADEISRSVILVNLVVVIKITEAFYSAPIMAIKSILEDSLQCTYYVTIFHAYRTV